MRFFKVFLAIFPILLIELTSSFLLRNDVLNSILQVIEEDSSLFWKNKNDLDLIFEGAKTSTNSFGFRHPAFEDKFKNSQYRIVTMGASPSFGWGVKDNETYTAMARESLKIFFDIEFLNASQIGYSSYQGLGLLQNRILKLKPTHVLIAYVINDLDYYRFFKDSSNEDKFVPIETSWKVEVRKFLRKINTYKLMEKVKLKLTENKNNTDINRINNRVSIVDYQNNLLEMIRICQKNGIIPILVKMPVNLNNLDPLALNNKNSSRKNMANKIYQNSLVYNLKMGEIAKLHNVDLIDVVMEFSKINDYLFLDPLRDTIHPNVLGHTVIAKLVVEKFKQILK